MIACAAAEHFEKGERSPLTLGVQSRLAITEVNKLYPKHSL
jgi:N6-L-threonylcarbamoyladenine synthase